MTKVTVIAKEIIEYVNSKKKMPKIVTIDKIGYNQNQMAYRLAYAITSDLKDSKNFHIDNATKPLGNKWNNKVKKEDYVNIAKKYVSFIEKNKRTPNYATLHGKKIAITLLIYEFARIVVYYNTHKKLPSNCTFDSAHVRGTTTAAIKEASVKKHGHATAHGCENMGQNNDWYCGVHSLQEVFRNLTGVVVKQDTIASWAGTTIAGTSHTGIHTAVATFNKAHSKNLTVEEKNFSDLGWKGLKNIIESKNKDFICHNNYRDQFGHYEVVNSIDDDVKVQNSLGDYCSNGCHCGYVESRSKSTYERYMSGISQKSIIIITNEV